MSIQLTDNAEALRLFLTEDIYLVRNDLTSKTVIKPTVTDEQPTDTIAKIEDKPTHKIEEQPLSIIAEPKATFEKNFDFKYKGRNQKGILILVEDAENELSNQKGVELLTKLMVAIKVTGNDVALINYANYNGANYNQLYHALNCNLILSFGVTANALQTPNTELHSIITYGKSRLVYTQHLHLLATDEAAKRKLWNTLKTLI